MSRDNTQNKGFTLVEIIIVLAILAVLAGSAIALTGLIPRRQVQSCTKKMVSQMEKTRTNAISFKDASLTLYKTADGVFVEMTVVKNGAAETVQEKLGNADLKIEYKVGSTGTYTEMGMAAAGNANKLIIRFDRSAGSFKDSSFGGMNLGDACTGIRVSKGRFVSELKLVKVTGKITYE